MRVLLQTLVGCLAMLPLAASRVVAQARPDSAACDKILATARVDSLQAGLFITARDVDGDLSLADEGKIALAVGAVFKPPRPLQLSVFSGPARLRLLRPIGGDTVAEPRAPSVISTLRIITIHGDTALHLEFARASMIVGFDSALVAAVQNAAVIRSMFMPQDGDDTLRVDVRIATDSIMGARRLFTGNFPRLPVVDAVPVATAPAPFPEEAKADSLDRGEVVFRFVVNREGAPEMGTVELIRATSASFVRAAANALPKQQFRPATVKGCAVPQVIDFPFAFVRADAPHRQH